MLFLKAGARVTGWRDNACVIVLHVTALRTAEGAARAWPLGHERVVVYIHVLGADFHTDPRVYLVHDDSLEKVVVPGHVASRLARKRGRKAEAVVLRTGASSVVIEIVVDLKGGYPGRVIVSMAASVSILDLEEHPVVGVGIVM